jgi:SAM-dependent MidA family methyltransferase
VTDRIEVGLRRVPGLDLAAPLPESDPRLLARIAAEIRSQGPMTFARFMDLALYDPDAGYYAGEPGLDRSRDGDVQAEAERGPGRTGDFLTAPEGHPIFGWTIARRLEAAWSELDRPDPFVIREHGAGSGALAVGILDGLRRSGSALLEAVRYQPIDVSARASRALEQSIEAAGLARYVDPADDRAAPGAVLANELLDALPVHLVEGGGGGALVERCVTLGPDGALELAPRSPSTPALAARLEAEGIVLAPGQRAEICLAIDDWVAGATASLERGVLLVIDYGAEASALYDPRRGSTLRAYHRHRVHADPLVAIGRQDLTAHVDLTALDRAAVAAGLTPLAKATQAGYLADLGLGELLVGLQSDPGTTVESYLAARSAVMRLLDPRATGGFAVREFGR